MLVQQGRFGNNLNVSKLYAALTDRNFISDIADENITVNNSGLRRQRRTKQSMSCEVVTLVTLEKSSSMVTAST